jgi:hypothetical protein
MPIDLVVAGAAAKTTVTGSMTIASPGGGGTFTVASAAGYPAAGKFSVTIERGLASEEKILINSRSGTTFTVGQRGYDGTSAADHPASSQCELSFPAVALQTLIDHENGTQANPHSGLLLNNAAHDVTARHTFGAALGTPGTPTALTPDIAGAAGSGTVPARSDHTHNVPAGTASTITGTNAEGVGASFARLDHNHVIGGTNHIPAAALVNKSIAAAQVTDGTIVNGSLLGTGQKLHYSQAADPGAVGADLLWWNTTTRCLLVRNAGNTAWEVLGGTGAWQPYTPALFNITLGDGLRFGRYIRLGRIIVGNIFFYIGGTTVFGANIGFGLPYNAFDADSFVGYPGTSTAEFYSHGASRGLLTGAGGIYAGVGVAVQAGASKALDRVQFFATAGTAAWGAGVPGAWGSGGRVSIFFEYEVADALDVNYD